MPWVLIFARNLPGLIGVGKNNRSIMQESIKLFLVAKALHSCQHYVLVARALLFVCCMLLSQ